MHMKSHIRDKLSYDTFLSLLSIIYVVMLFHFTIAMWETRQRYGILFLALSLMICYLLSAKQKVFLGAKGKIKDALFLVFLTASLLGGLYFWVEYPDLTYYRAGACNNLDLVFSAIYIYLTIQITWKRVGATISLIALAFIGYMIFGHLLPGTFLKHSQISLTEVLEICAGQIDGIFGPLVQIGATWVAIFAFFAGFVEGFGGLNYILRLCKILAGNRKRSMPQIALISSMAFGGMSGSAVANAVGTGAFTIPTMKRFGLPSTMAAAVESVASSGGQIMPPILGAAAFLMCDYLGMHLSEIILASLFPAILFFGSTSLSIYFLARRNIDTTSNVQFSKELEAKMSFKEICEGIPIALAFVVLILVFIVYRVNILLGGFFTTVVFLCARFIYDLIVSRGKASFLFAFMRGLHQGVLIGARNMASIGVMLGSLGIVVSSLISTGLSEKISFYMVSTFGGNLWIFLFFTMIICIIFGMAVTTVGAYILAITLAAPALTKLGIDPLVAHFVVFYWAMLSAFTPPVAPVCVATSAIAGAKFLPTCWESMKLGFPKFILPVVFITRPDILKFNLMGITAFCVCCVSFLALSAGIQSGWGLWQQAILFALGFYLLFATTSYMWITMVITILVFCIMWIKYNQRVVSQT